MCDESDVCITTLKDPLVELILKIWTGKQFFITAFVMEHAHIVDMLTVILRTLKVEEHKVLDVSTS